MVATSPSVTVRRAVLASPGQSAANIDLDRSALQVMVRRLLDFGAWLAAKAFLEVALLLVAVAIGSVV